MNNLLSYFGLVDARLRASEKYLPILCIQKNSPYAQQRASRENKSEHIINREKEWLHSDVRNI